MKASAQISEPFHGLIEALALGPEPGGALRYAYEVWPRLAQRLARTDGSLHVLLARSQAWSETHLARWQAAGIRVHWADRPAPRPLSRWRHGGQAVRDVLQACAQEGHPITCLQTQSSVPLPRRLPSSGPPIRRVHLCHGLRPLRSGPAWRRWVATRALQRCLQSADAWIAVSQSLRAEMLAQFPGLRDRPGWVACPGSDHHAFEAREPWRAPHGLFWMGPAAAHKGAQTLALACDRLPAEAPQTWCLRAEEAQELLAPYPALRQRIQRVEPPAMRIPKTIAQDAVIVLPSELESFGIVVLEALASGHAMAVSDLPAHREVVGSASDCVQWFSPGDAAGLAAAVQLAWQSDSPQAAQQRQAQAKTFLWQTAVQATAAAWGLGSL